jgi:hypothetical chaperone protein
MHSSRAHVKTLRVYSPTSQANVAIGIDFGTTNSSIAFADRSDEVQLAKFSYLGGVTDAYRSLLYLQQVKEGGVSALKSWTGPEGIEHYLSADVKGRLIQSLKSFLSSRTLHSTEVFGRRFCGSESDGGTNILRGVDF